MVIRGRIQKCVVVLEADASVPEGTEVAVVVPATPETASEMILNDQRQRVLQIMDRIAAMPIDAVDEPFSGAEHGNVLHSP